MKKTTVLLVLVVILSTLSAERMITLDEARELLLINNPEYLSKESALKSAEWEMHQALSSIFPAARMQAGYNHLDPKPFTGAQENYSLSYGISVTQPIFMGGKLWLSYRMSRDRVRIARADLENTKLTLLGKLEEAYYNSLLSEELYQINHRAKELGEKQLEIAQTRLEAGTLSRADYLQFQTDLSIKEVAHLQAENSRLLSFRSLQNLLKIDKFSVEPVDFDKYDELIEFYRGLDGEEREESRERLIGYGMEHNPLLIMSRAGQNIAQKGLYISAGNFLPTINLSASKNWSDNFSGENNFESSTTYMLSASIPIFPIIDNYSGYRSRLHALRRTEREVESAEDSIKLAIEAAFYSGIAAAKTIASSEMAFEYAEETYRMMEERFRNGLISSVDMISIELLLTTSTLNATNSRYDFLKNRSALMRLLNIENDNKLLELMQRGL